MAGTFGVVTSLVVKAYDASEAASVSHIIQFTTGGGITNVVDVSNTTFWAGVRSYFSYAPKICDMQGVGYNFLWNLGNGTLLFTVLFLMPAMSVPQADAAANTYYLNLNALGINVTNTYANSSAKRSIYLEDLMERTAPATPSLVDTTSVPYPSRGAGAQNVRLASRLFPRKNLEDPTLFNATMQAIETAVLDGGYTLHSANHCPTLAAAGYPNNSILAAYRNTAMHAQLWDSGYAIGSPELKKQRWDRFQTYFKSWRDVSPGAGAYMGEADPSEPHWQTAFYGENYARLLSVKQKWDPWGLFWAQTAVGSEGWEVKTPFPAELPTQNVSTLQFLSC
jgi:Berberine and berberine like